MSKRPFDPNKLTNELSGASSFFKQTPPASSPSEPNVAPAAPTPTPHPEEPRTPVRPGRVIKRQMIRHPFELYLDQLEQLREVAQAERQHGGAGSMSKMVREAIDQFLAQLPPPTG